MLGKFSSEVLARAALLSAFLRSPGWWNGDAVRVWGVERGIDWSDARGLVRQLHELGALETRVVSGRLNWRAKKC